MADSNGDQFPELDKEMRERLLPKGPSGFRFGGSIKPDSSLQLFIKKRAPRGYQGFVDAVSMAPTSSFQNRGVKVFNGVVNSTVGSESDFLQGKMDEQLKYLSHLRHGSLAQQLLLTETLPQHEYELNIGNIADCLCADSPAVRRDAVSRLERLILVTNHKSIQAARNQFLAVVQKTYDVIHDDTSQALMKDADHLRVCGHLHLVAVSAVLCQPNSKSSLTELRPFMSSQKVKKKQAGCEVKQEVLKLLSTFYENVERRLKSTAAAIDLKKFIKANFCDQMSLLVWTFNQIADEDEWSSDNDSLKLLADLKDVCDLIAREGKRLRSEVKAGLDTFLVRSLVVLLNSTFAKVRQTIGEGSYSHPVRAAELLASVARRLHSQHQVKNFLPHISTAAFHENPEVRHIITELLDSLHQPTLQTALDYLEASLGTADFHADHPERPEEACKWHTLKGRFGKRAADFHVLVHAGKCKAKRSSSSECVDHPRGQDDDEWERQRHSMEMLVKLSASSQGTSTLSKSSAHKYHNPLVQLMAFQNSPFLFYATESIKGRRLLEQLINHRAAHRWLPTSVLVRVMHDIIYGLEFLASKGIASREITTFYMMVGGRCRRGGVASEKMDVLTTDDFTVKLTDLGLAHQFRRENDRKGSIRPVDMQGPIPLLWTPPEGLLRGEYSELSMVYSAGCVMYELWTHGCQPFATYQKSTADTVRMMLLKPDSMPLIRWPCIPEEVHGIMRKCTQTDPFSRPSLASLKQVFMEMHTRRNSHDDAELFNVGDRETDFPSFSDDQVRRKHLPDLGIPPDVEQVIEDYKKNRNDSYRNMRVSRWVDYASNSPEGADRELNSAYWMQVAYLEDFTSVRERLPPSFVEKELHLLEKCTAKAQGHLHGVTDWLQGEQFQPVLEEESQDHIVHERLYKPAWTLLDAACKGVLATTESGYVAMAMERYVHVLLSLARALHALHDAGWLHRDIRASNVLVDCQTGEVTLARLGRMCQMKSSSGCVTGEPFEDSWRWLGPEVLSDGNYTQANDVFMFGTCIWETFWCREVTEKNPTATEMNFLPFADQPKENILTIVRQKKLLKKPQTCPDWLYQLSVNCRDPDPAMRPFTADIILTLEGELIPMPDTSRRFLHHPKLLVAAHERCSAGGMSVPDLPARFDTKHAKPFSGRAVDDRTPAPKRPINLSSIKLDASSTIPEDGAQYSAAYDPSPHAVPGAAGYLTPISDEVKSVVDAVLGRSGARKQDEHRSASEADVCHGRHRDLQPNNKERSSSDSELRSNSNLGLNVGFRGSSVPGGRVFRQRQGYPSGRGLPPVPTEEEDDGDTLEADCAQDVDKDTVYDEI